MNYQPLEMKNTIPVLILIATLTILGCDSNSQKEISTFSQVPEAESLKERKAQIDTLFKYNLNDLEVYAIINGEETPKRIIDESIPENTIKAFELLVDSTGQLRSVSEYPLSISGDWYLSFIHYFDKEGKTFAFERQTNFFNSSCSEIAFETITLYYNTDFTRIDSTYKLVDENEIQLNKDSCDFPYQFEYSVEKNISNLLRREKIVRDD
jgi:hypothetical protein